MNWLIEFSVKVKDLILIHYISFTQELLCTGLTTDRIYVR